MSKNVKSKVLVIGPMSSGHIQKWVDPIINDYEFVFFTLHNSSTSTTYRGHKVKAFPKLTNTKLDFLFALPYLLYLMLRIKPNLIHAHFLSSYGLMVGLACPRNVPKILSTWGTDVNGKVQKSAMLKHLVKVVSNKFITVNAPAHHMKEKMVKLGFDEDAIEVFQYGIDLDSYPTKSIDEMKGGVSFLSIRNWDELYNIENLISGYQVYCRNTNTASKLVLLGRGPASQEKKILKLISSLDFGAGEVIVKGFVDSETLKSTIYQADVLISIPSMDGAPLSVLEAAYVGLIPVLSNIDANHEWFNAKNAVFVEPQNIESIANGIEQAVKIVQSDHADKVMCENREKIVHSASYQINTRRMKNLYEQLLEG